MPQRSMELEVSFRLFGAKRMQFTFSVDLHAQCSERGRKLVWRRR